MVVRADSQTGLHDMFKEVGTFDMVHILGIHELFISARISQFCDSFI